MKKSSLARVSGVALVTAGLVFAPALAASAVSPASPAVPSTGLSASVTETGVLPAQTGDGLCTVTDGTLTWGLKETFRSYIQSSIAKGDWELIDGVTYELPNFVWSGGTGSVDPQTGVGEVSFAGGLNFTGHDGVLDMWVENPTIEFAEDGSGVIRVDARSNDVDGNPKVEVTQEEFATLPATNMNFTLDVASGDIQEVTLADLEAVLTEAGVPAFGDFYAAGDALDPVSIALTVDCTSVSSEAPADEATEGDADAVTGEDQVGDTDEVDEAADESDAAADESTIPWLPIGIAGAALIVIAVAVTMLVMNRKRE